MPAKHCSYLFNARPAPFNPARGGRLPRGRGARATARSAYIEHGLAASLERPPARDWPYYLL